MRQGEQNFRIRDHQLRRIERANEIFSFRQIHARLTADGAVHLRYERRWDVHKTDAAQIGGSGETGDVADDSAAHRYNCGVTIGAGQDQLSRDLLDGGEIFRRFAVVEKHGAHRRAFSAAFVERAQQRTAPMFPHAWRGEHVDAGGFA